MKKIGYISNMKTKFHQKSAKRGTIMYIGSIEQKSQKAINISKLSSKIQMR